MANELILIVEDNDKNRKLVRDVLQVKGYRVAEAETREEGVRLARELHPDLILMDIQLPGIDGIRAFRPRPSGDCDDSRDRRDGLGHDPGSADDHGRGLRGVSSEGPRRAKEDEDGNHWMAMHEIKSCAHTLATGAGADDV